jgi:tetratricopeptide (TPR) repeat protein
MKKIILILVLCLSFNLLYGQNSIDSLVKVGIKYHDNGEYDKAIEVYKKALEIEPKSTLVNCEISLTYMYAGDCKKCIKHSDLVIKLNKEHVVSAYINKGSCLDVLGKTKESIKLFEEAIKKHGGNNLLYYNLGIDYYKIKDYKKAEVAFIDAINQKPSHASSHFALGNIKYEENQRVPSLLSLYYFLFLEPTSTRAKTAYLLLKKQLEGNVQKDANNPNNINITLNSSQLGSEFNAADLIISLFKASNSFDENKNKTEEELFINNTKSFFTVLGESKKSNNIWWDFYTPFFYKLAQTNHIETFCYYIIQSSNDKAIEWIDENSEKIEQFDNWLSEEE